MKRAPHSLANHRKRLRDLLAAHLDELRSLNHSPTTLKAIDYGNRTFLTWLEQSFRVRYVDQLRERHMPAWLKYLNSYRTSKGRALKPRSVNKRIEVVRGPASGAAETGPPRLRAMEAGVAVGGITPGPPRWTARPR